MTAGYLALGGAARDTLVGQLTALCADGDTAAAVPNTPYHVLWRKALLAPGQCVWRGSGRLAKIAGGRWLTSLPLPGTFRPLDTDVTMVDFSSELLGLSTLWLGADFFRRHTAHTFPLPKPLTRRPRKERKGKD